MSLNIIGGGNQGNPLRTYCTFESHLVTKSPSVGDFVELTLSGNWTVSEHGDHIAATEAGILRSIDDDGKHGTVEWLTWKTVYNVAYSGTATRNYAIRTAVSHTESLATSSNATQALFAKCAAVNVPSSGYMDIITV